MTALSDEELEKVYDDAYERVRDAQPRSSPPQRRLEIAHTASLRAVREACLRECMGEIPQNWCDPLLTGQYAVKIPADCPDIERLLNSIRERLRALLSARLPREGE